MTRPWTLADSRLIAERVMEWQVTEHNGRLFLADTEHVPDWLVDCAVPDWPRDPAGASMALACWCQEQGVTATMRYLVRPVLFQVELNHMYDNRKRTTGEARDWSEAVMLAVLAAVER